MTRKEDKIVLLTPFLSLAISLGASWLVGCTSERNSNDKHNGAKQDNSATQPHTRSVNDIVEVRRFRINSDSGIKGVAFSPDGKYLASATWGHLTLWNWKSGTKYKTLKAENVEHTCVAFSPDGKEVVTGAKDGFLRFWNVKSGTMTRTLGKHAGNITRVAFSSDGKRLIAAARETKELLRLWDLKTGKLIRCVIGATSSTVCDVGFLAGDSKAIGVGWITETTGEEGATIWVFDLIKGAENVRNVPDAFLIAVAPFPGRSNRFIIGGGVIDGLDVRDVNTGTVIQHIPGLSKTEVHSIAVTPDGRYVLTGGTHARERSPTGLLDPTDCLVLWDMINGKMIKEFSANDLMGLNVAFSPDGRFAASGGVKYVVIWELKE